MRDSRPLTFVVLVAAAVASLGHNGGCHPDEGEPLASPVQALGVVLELDGEVSAELVLVSMATDTPQHVDGAASAVRIPGDHVVPLEPVAPGTYASRGSLPMAYEAGAHFTFELSLDEATARAHRAVPGAVALAIHGGAEVPQIWLEADRSEVTVAWSPAGIRALVDVFDDAGERTYATLDWDDPDISAGTWKRFPEGGSLTLPASALRGTAPHRIRVCAVEVFRRDGEPVQGPQHAADGDGFSSGLGWLSGGVAGRCNVLDLEE